MLILIYPCPTSVMCIAQSPKIGSFVNLLRQANYSRQRKISHPASMPNYPTAFHAFTCGNHVDSILGTVKIVLVSDADREFTCSFRMSGLRLRMQRLVKFAVFRRLLGLRRRTGPHDAWHLYCVECGRTSLLMEQAKVRKCSKQSYSLRPLDQ